MQWEKIHQLHAEIRKLEGDAAEQHLTATEQVEKLQAELSAQAKNHHMAQEALVIEEKCKRDQLQVKSATDLPCQ